MSTPEATPQATIAAADPTADAPVLSPTPALLWWAFAIPTFAVLVYGMQVFLAPRMQAAAGRPVDDPEEDS